MVIPVLAMDATAEVFGAGRDGVWEYVRHLIWMMIVISVAWLISNLVAAFVVCKHPSLIFAQTYAFIHNTENRTQERCPEIALHPPSIRPFSFLLFVHAFFLEPSIDARVVCLFIVVLITSTKRTIYQRTRHIGTTATKKVRRKSNSCFFCLEHNSRTQTQTQFTRMRNSKAYMPYCSDWRTFAHFSVSCAGDWSVVFVLFSVDWCVCRRAKHMQTLIRVLGRAVKAFIILVTIAIILLSFPKVREIGTGVWNHCHRHACSSRTFTHLSHIFCVLIVCLFRMCFASTFNAHAWHVSQSHRFSIMVFRGSLPLLLSDN